LSREPFDSSVSLSAPTGATDGLDPAAARDEAELAWWEAAGIPKGVDPTAWLGPGVVVEPGARIGPQVRLEAQAYVGPGVVLEAGVQVGVGAVILGPCRIGPRTRIFPRAVIGAEAQDRKFQGEETGLWVGADNVFREFSTAHRGTGPGGITKIGSGNLFMVHAHVAHDCRIGDGVVLANSVALAGHVVLGDRAVVGGLAAIHQHVRVGRLAMIGGGSMVAQDVPPFCLAQGDRARLLGLNRVGLQRAGFSESARRELQEMVPFLFRIPRAWRREDLPQFWPDSELFQELCGFFLGSTRGVCRLSPDPV
jgi:UDP-N-acetylglucosamine acyltransferase